MSSSLCCVVFGLKLEAHSCQLNTILTLATHGLEIPLYCVRGLKAKFPLAIQEGALWRKWVDARTAQGPSLPAQRTLILHT